MIRTTRQGLNRHLNPRQRRISRRYRALQWGKGVAARDHYRELDGHFKRIAVKVARYTPDHSPARRYQRLVALKTKYHAAGWLMAKGLLFIWFGTLVCISPLFLNLGKDHTPALVRQVAPHHDLDRFSQSHFDSLSVKNRARL